MKIKLYLFKELDDGTPLDLRFYLNPKRRILPRIFIESEDEFFELFTREKPRFINPSRMMDWGRPIKDVYNIYEIEWDRKKALTKRTVIKLLGKRVEANNPEWLI